MHLAPVYLVKNKTLSSDSGTLYVDLPLNEQIERLVFEFNATKTSTADHTNPIFDQISKIEVALEGGSVVDSFEVEVGSILAWLASGQLPPHEPRERGVAEICLPIFFGRWPEDEEYGLDTAGYKSAQLQVTYSIDTTDWATGTGMYSVYYMRPIERANWRGVVRQRTIEMLTTSGTAGSETILLPHKYPWLRVGLRVFDIDQYIYNNPTAVALSVDEDRVSLMKVDTDDLININRMWYPEAVDAYPVDSTCIDGDNPQSYLALLRNVAMCSFAAAPRILAFDSWLGHTFNLRMITDGGVAVATAETIAYQATGYCPHGALVLFDNVYDPYPADKHANGKIELTTGAYAATIEVFLQELVEGKL